MKKIVFFGAGNIAQALIEGMISNGHNKSNILFIDRNSQNSKKLKKIGIKELNLKEAKKVDLFIIAVKPKDALNAFKEINENYKKTKIVSLVAGIKSKKYLAVSRTTEFIRAMPNTSSRYGKGITGLINISATKKTFKTVKDIFSSVGIFVELDKENKMDDFTGLLGSGPAYFFYLLKVYEKRIMKLCNGDEKKMKMVIGNLIEGVGISSRDNKSMDQLIAAVASKKGTTEAGLNSFKSSKLSDSFEKGIIAAINRSKEISNES